jgi:hypothetical protein
MGNVGSPGGASLYVILYSLADCRRTLCVWGVGAQRVRQRKRKPPPKRRPVVRSRCLGWRVHDRIGKRDADVHQRRADAEGRASRLASAPSAFAENRPRRLRCNARESFPGATHRPKNERLKLVGHRSALCFSAAALASLSVVSTKRGRKAPRTVPDRSILHG